MLMLWWILAKTTAGCCNLRPYLFSLHIRKDLPVEPVGLFILSLQDFKPVPGELD